MFQNMKNCTGKVSLTNVAFKTRSSNIDNKNATFINQPIK